MLQYVYILLCTTFSISFDGNGSDDTGLKLLTPFLFPVLGIRVTLAIFQLFGISDLAKDKLKSSVILSVTHKKASLNISEDMLSTQETSYERSFENGQEKLVISPLFKHLTIA